MNRYGIFPEWRPGMTVREAWMQASSFLREHGPDQDAGRVAEWLLLHLLGRDRTSLYLHWDERFPEERWPDWCGLLRRRAEGEPVQYITGEQEFMGRSFRVGPEVLIPRPETEILVETMLKWGREAERDNRRKKVSFCAADIGTGSGVIAVSLALGAPEWRIAATDGVAGRSRGRG